MPDRAEPRIHVPTQVLDENEADYRVIAGDGPYGVSTGYFKDTAVPVVGDTLILGSQFAQAKFTVMQAEDEPHPHTGARLALIVARFINYV